VNASVIDFSGISERFFYFSYEKSFLLLVFHGTSMNAWRYKICFSSLFIFAYTSAYYDNSKAFYLLRCRTINAPFCSCITHIFTDIRTHELLNSLLVIVGAFYAVFSESRRRLLLQRLLLLLGLLLHSCFAVEGLDLC
jgi:hypothetical protein